MLLPLPESGHPRAGCAGLLLLLWAVAAATGLLLLWPTPGSLRVAFEAVLHALLARPDGARRSYPCQLIPPSPALCSQLSPDPQFTKLHQVTHLPGSMHLPRTEPDVTVTSASSGPPQPAQAKQATRTGAQLGSLQAPGPSQQVA